MVTQKRLKKNNDATKWHFYGPFWTILYVQALELMYLSRYTTIRKKLLSSTCYDVHLYLARKRTAGEIKPAGDAFLFRFCFPRYGMMQKL